MSSSLNVYLTKAFLHVLVPGRGCEEAEHQSSSLVSGGRSGGAGRFSTTCPHQSAERESLLTVNWFSAAVIERLTDNLCRRMKRIASSSSCPLIGRESLTPAQLRRSSSL